MPLNGETSESELQQNLEQLNVTENDGHKRVVEVHAVEGESASYDKRQDRKTTLDNNIINEKKWTNETTCHSEDGSHEIVTNDNDKDKDYTSSADESDFSLPKHRKDYPSDDERTDSEQPSNEEDETGSEDSNYRLIPPQKSQSSSETYAPYEQTTPIKSSNTLQINGVNIPFEVSPMSLGDSSLQDDDIDIARIVNPVVRCIADLKSEFRTQLAKTHYCPNINLDEVEVDENWQHTEFEKSQDQYCYNAIATAGKLLDVIMPMQLPEEAKKHLSKARRILRKKASLCRTNTESINLSSSSISRADNDVDPVATVTTTDNNENSKSSGSSAQVKNSGENNNKTSAEIDNKAEGQTSTVVATKNKESSNNHHNVTNPHKYRRGTSQGRKLRHSVRGSPTYSSPKSGRRSQNYSPRTPNSRSPRVGSTSIAGSATQANNRRFVGFLPSRCFTCGGIGHYATNCPNKGSYITSSNQQPSRSRRRNLGRYKRTVETITSNE